jgi:poly(A) polymerase
MDNGGIICALVDRPNSTRRLALTSPDAPIAAPAPAPRIIPRSEHTISRSQISPNALRVLYRLREGGFQAFLVGGCVRDLLIGMEPKDFDVATDALPEDVKKLFRNCRLIGRRFRLAHVFFGRETIEVATFRAAAAPEPGDEVVSDVEDEAPDTVTADDIEANIAAELGDDDDADEGDLDDADDLASEAPASRSAAALIDAGTPPEAAAEEPDEDFDDTVTLLPDADLAADLANDPIEVAEKTVVLPVPPGFLQEQGDASRVPPRDYAAARAASTGAVRSGPADRGNEPEPHQAGGSRRDRRRDRFDEDADAERVLDTHGRILRDNVYGSIDADVWRRDFTANALYYNIADFSLWDYVGGAEDIAARRLKLIGDPETRYREDPVRMLRAARFEAKLNFTIDEPTATPITELRGLLQHVPPARLFDESLKLFLSGHGVRSLEVLRRRRLLDVLLPATATYLDKHPGGLVEQLLIKGLANTDERALAGKPVTPTYLFALLLYGPIAREIESSPPSQWHELHTILEACDRAVREAQRHMSIPRRFSLGLREMFALQPRLEHPRGRRALRVLEHPRFRAAYDLLLLRAGLGLASVETADWWTRIQEVSGEERARMADEVGGTRSDSPPRSGPSRRGPRRRRRGGRRSSNPD